MSIKWRGGKKKMLKNTRKRMKRTTRKLRFHLPFSRLDLSMAVVSTSIPNPTHCYCTPELYSAALNSVCLQNAGCQTSP